MLRRQSELEQQVHDYQQDMKALNLQNETIKKENARLYMEMNHKVTLRLNAH